jgi:hypothetical protein
VYSDSIASPMMGVGAFFISFWAGFVVGFDAGLPCAAIPLNALLFGILGCWLVVKISNTEQASAPGRSTDDGTRSIPETNLSATSLALGSRDYR